jgi:hypothetical protein
MRLVGGFFIGPLATAGELAGIVEGGVELAEATDDLAAVVTETERGEVAGGVVFAAGEEKIVGEADAPAEIFLVATAHPIDAREGLEVVAADLDADGFVEVDKVVPVLARESGRTERPFRAEDVIAAAEEQLEVSRWLDDIEKRRAAQER